MPLYDCKEPDCEECQKAFRQPAKAWTVGDFWEYVAGLTDKYECQQMQTTLAEHGMKIVAVIDQPHVTFRRVEP